LLVEKGIFTKEGLWEMMRGVDKTMKKEAQLINLRWPMAEREKKLC
jgi:hypothetical protein